MALLPIGVEPPGVNIGVPCPGVVCGVIDGVILGVIPPPDGVIDGVVFDGVSSQRDRLFDAPGVLSMILSLAPRSARGVSAHPLL